MSYPHWLKKFNQLRWYIWPEYSERLFIKVLGRWWLWSRGFKHQPIIAGYMPDFANDHLIIEVDGRGKVPKDIIKQQEYWDSFGRREQVLTKLGYRILRVPFYMIRDDPRKVRRAVRRWARHQHFLITNLKV